jgi:hypothetical protein
MIYNANGGIQPPVIASYVNGRLYGTSLPNSNIEVLEVLEAIIPINILAVQLQTEAEHGL